MSESFAGKVALISGGTSGIRSAMAVAFAEEGANVVVAGRRENEGAESIKLVEKAGGNGLFVRTNVNVENEVETMAACTVEYFCASFITGAALSGNGGITGLSLPASEPANARKNFLF